MDQKVIDERLAICDNCEHSSNPGDRIMNYCNLCGCSIDMITSKDYKQCIILKWRSAD